MYDEFFQSYRRSMINPFLIYFINGGSMATRVVTHNGIWHADEVLAIALLSLVVGEVDVIRTRDVDVIENYKSLYSVYVLDVGGEYNPRYLNFDHHMRDFDLKNSYGNKMSTFGLMVKYLEQHFSEGVYNQLLEFANRVDCQDNGISASPELYWISDMNALNDFESMVKMAADWLRAKFIKWNQYDIDTQAVERVEVRGKFVVSDVRIPIDERLNKNPDVLLAVYPAHSGYNIQSLNVGLAKDFSVRCPAPEEWRGLTGDELSAKVGIPGMVFCHAGGFLTVADTMENAIKVAELISSQ